MIILLNYIKDCTQKILLENTFDGEKFSFIGCNGWYKKGCTRAQFDQQPLEVVSTVLMLQTAYQITGNKSYQSLQKRAFDWFLGENDLRMTLYDFETQGCCDGIEKYGINRNQGAESTLAYLISHLRVLRGFEQLHKLSL